MKKHLIKIVIIFVLFIVGFSGCTEQNTNGGTNDDNLFTNDVNFLSYTSDKLNEELGFLDLLSDFDSSDITDSEIKNSIDYSTKLKNLMSDIQINIPKYQLSNIMANVRESFINYSKEMLIAYDYLIKAYQYEKLLYEVWDLNSENWTNTSDISDEWWSYFENQSSNYSKFEEHSNNARKYYNEYKNWVDFWETYGYQ